MFFEFLPDELDFMNRFAARLHTTVVGDTLMIPEAVGSGQVTCVNLSPDFNLVLHTYTLKEELVIRRLAPEKPEDVISFLFNINQDLTRSRTDKESTEPSVTNELAIRIISHDLASDIRFPPNSLINYVVIVIRRETLKALLAIQNPNRVVETILTETSSFLFYETLSPSFQKVLKQLTDAELTNPLLSLRYRINVHELIYLVFDRLLQRQTDQHSPVNQADIDKIFRVRQAVLSNLSSPPSLKHLSTMCGLSVTKMAGLFSQIFGDTIYNYYQTVRMAKAADLLKTGTHSVAETGYYLGFVNLSHFARVFEKHHGMKPKKYSSRP